MELFVSRVLSPMMALVDRLQGLLSTEDPTEPYQCPGCASRFELQYHVCPDCGGYSIHRCWVNND
jgi:rRNA maturation endonuclease Nob1